MKVFRIIVYILFAISSVACLGIGHTTPENIKIFTTGMFIILFILFGIVVPKVNHIPLSDSDLRLLQYYINEIEIIKTKIEKSNSIEERNKLLDQWSTYLKIINKLNIK